VALHPQPDDPPHRADIAKMLVLYTSPPVATLSGFANAWAGSAAA